MKEKYEVSGAPPRPELIDLWKENKASSSTQECSLVLSRATSEDIEIPVAAEPYERPIHSGLIHSFEDLNPILIQTCTWLGWTISRIDC